MESFLWRMDGTQSPLRISIRTVSWCCPQKFWQGNSEIKRKPCIGFRTRKNPKSLDGDIDKNWKIKRQFVQAYGVVSSVILPDTHGRILQASPFNGVELLDSEFNRLPLDWWFLAHLLSFRKLHYDSERNEIMSMCRPIPNPDDSVLTTFRLTEE